MIGAEGLICFSLSFLAEHFFPRLCELIDFFFFEEDV